MLSLGLSLGCALVFVCSTLGKRGLSPLESRIWPVLTALLCVLLAVAAAVGFMLFARVPFGQLTGTIFFFVLGIGELLQPAFLKNKSPNYTDACSLFTVFASVFNWRPHLDWCVRVVILT